MQFSCESCKTQLQIADEKVRGKRLIVRCKRCGAKITITDPALAQKAGQLRPPAAPGQVSSPGHASAPAPVSSAGAGRAPVFTLPRDRPAPAQPQAARRASDDESTRAMDSDLLEKALQASKSDDPGAVTNGARASRPPARVAARADAPAWFAMLHGKQIGPLARAQLRAMTDDGAVGPRTYLWKEGMESWQRARDLPELSELFPKLPDPSAPPPLTSATPPSKAGALPDFPTSDFALRDVMAQEKKRAAQAAEAAQDLGGVEVVEKQLAGPPIDTPVPGRLSRVARVDEERAGKAQLPLGERVLQEEVADLFAEPDGSQKSALDLARWASAELVKKSNPAHPKLAAPASHPPRSARRMFDGAAPQHTRGPFGVFLVLAVLAAGAVALWLQLGGAEKKGDGKPEASQAGPAAAAPAKPGSAPGKPADKAPQKPVETGLTPDQVRKKLDENKGALQACIDEALRRDPNLGVVGKIHIKTSIAPSGQVTAAQIDKRTVEESPLGTCLRRATRRIAFPRFAGDAFEVDIPILVTPGE
jgi:predicted Zn finger-like uncharacterized protein